MLVLFLILLSLSAFAQYEGEEYYPEYDHYAAPVEEEPLYSDYAPEITDDTAEYEEYAHPDDIPYPEGEESWSLGNEDLPAEYYE